MSRFAAKVLTSAVVTGVLICAMTTAAFAAELSAGMGTVTASALKLRAEPTTSSSCLTLLPQGTSVVVLDDSTEGWYQVNYEGETGYLSADYVSFSTSGSASLGNGKVTGDGVNVRSAANTSSSVLGTVSKGDVLAVTGFENGWYKVSYNSKTGYIRSDYMTITKDALSSRGTTASTSSSSSTTGSKVVAFAKKYLGVKYTYGGSSGKGFDCSGFTMFVMKNFGYSLPHTATGQMSYGTSVAKSALQPGDLVFFCDPSRSNGKAASHVGIYIGSNQFIHASSGGGKVQIDSLSTAYYAKYYVGARRIVK